jgi:hypothetical protein
VLPVQSAPVGGAPVATSFAPLAIAATVAGATAAIVVGAITISVNSRPIAAEATANTPKATYTIGDVTVAVPGKEITVDPQQIHFQQPNVSASVPPLSFHFPQIPIDDQVMRNFTTAMQNYSAALQAQSAHDERLDRLLSKALAVESENSVLRTRLEIKPTQEQVDKLVAENQQRKKIDDAVQAALKKLADATAEQDKGTTLGALQYLRSLNAQNQHYVNRIFRPALVHENCVTYYNVAKQFGGKIPVAPCITPLWGDDELEQPDHAPTLSPAIAANPKEGARP